MGRVQYQSGKISGTKLERKKKKGGRRLFKGRGEGLELRMNLYSTLPFFIIAVVTHHAHGGEVRGPEGGEKHFPGMRYSNLLITVPCLLKITT